MRILVHDFSGHPFQAELARSLGRRGHDVLHVQCESYRSGKGALEGDSDGVRFQSVSLGRAFERYSIRDRLAQELRYARRFVRAANDFRPDLIISCNDPLVAKAAFGAWAAVRRVPWVFWLQDVYSVAMTREACRRSRAGRLLGQAFQWVERRLLRSADAVVAITVDFDQLLDDWGIARDKRTIIENWAPLSEVPLRDRSNPWRQSQGLGDAFVHLYAGTLGLKHDPDLLADLATADPSSEVVVVSEGLGADHLRQVALDRSLRNLRILAYQPWEELPDVLAAADVLVVLLDAEAGTFSVPSKILTSLCAGRPILASMPPENLGARTITCARAGFVVEPGDVEDLVRCAKLLRTDPDLRRSMGAGARAHAERAFDITTITDRFERVITAALSLHQKEATAWNEHSSPAPEGSSAATWSAV